MDPLDVAAWRIGTALLTADAAERIRQLEAKLGLPPPPPGLSLSERLERVEVALNRMLS